MLLQIVAIVAVLFFISVIFYKYNPVSLSDIRLIQLEWEQIDTWPELRTENQPVIIRGAPTGNSPVWTSADLETRNIEDIPVQYGTATAYNTAYHHFVTKWVNTWLPKSFHSSPVLEKILPVSTQAITGQQVINKTTASWTSIMPTDSTLIVSIANPSCEEFLPTNWRNKDNQYFFTSLSKFDTPFVGEIKYIDIKLRPGTVLSIPCHWFFSIQSEDDAPHIIASECHTPVSYFASKILNRN